MSCSLSAYLDRISVIEKNNESFESDFFSMLESEGVEGIEEKVLSMANDYNGYDLSEEAYRLLREHCAEEESDEEE